MHPYPCKFCHGWHNGHRQTQPLMQFEPKCRCGHNAAHHDRLSGYGCYECACLESLEYVYRAALRRLTRDRDHQIERVRRARGVFEAIIRHVPQILRRAMAGVLYKHFRRRPHPKESDT